MFNRRTWTKEENEQLQEGMASLGGPAADLGKNVSYLLCCCTDSTDSLDYVEVLDRVYLIGLVIEGTAHSL